MTDRLQVLMVHITSELANIGSATAHEVVLSVCPELTPDEAEMLILNTLEGSEGASAVEAVLASLATGIALGRALERGELQ